MAPPRSKKMPTTDQTLPACPKCGSAATVGYHGGDYTTRYVVHCARQCGSNFAAGQIDRPRPAVYGEKVDEAVRAWRLFCEAKP